MSPEEVSDLTGKTVGRFAIRARLGVGGMGEVYRADDTRLKRPVALKRIAPRLQADEIYRQRFLHEAQCASGLTSENVAGLYDVLEENGEIFLVMEYVEGQTLRQRLAQPLGIPEFLQIAVQCAAALVAAHERGIVHRDIKPENVMLTPAGQVKVLDFGVAKRLPHADNATTLESSTGGSSFSGTPAYMAPEVLLDKEPDQRADIFSLGVVFYEALSGRQPFLTGNFLATVDRVLHEEPAPLPQLNPKVPAELERIVAKMLAKHPVERYATAADLLVDLRAVERAGAYPGSLPARAPAKPRAFASRTGWVLAAAVGILLIAAIGLLPKLHEQWGRWFGSPVLAGPKNLAVLPFQAIGGSPENQAFCDGITENLTASLTQLTATHALQVMPAREVRTRRIANADAARKELGVSLVLEGTMDRSGKAVRINYALVDARTLRQVRAGTITAEASDPFAVQDRVAAALVSMLQLELKPQERQALVAHGTQVAGAYEFYLRGRGYLQNYDKPENIENAINVFQRALQLDPNYALAHAGLGQAYWMRYQATKETLWVEPARQACERALNLDSKLAAARVCKGTVDNGTGQYDQAIAEFQRALDSEPTSDDAYRGLAEAYEHLGKLAEAEKTYHRAIALRPQYWPGYNWLGVFYYHQARYPEAAQMFTQVLALAPDNVRGHYNLGATYVEEGRYAEATVVLERSLAMGPTAAAYSNLGVAYFRLRRFAEAGRAFEQAVKLNEGKYLLWWNLAEGYYWTPGKRLQATSAYRQTISLAKDMLRVNPKDASVLGILALCHAMRGERGPALRYLQRGLQLAPDDPEMRFRAAVAYNQLGDVDQALRWLEKALAAGYSRTTVRDTPNFDPLRANPRFQELLRGE